MAVRRVAPVLTRATPSVAPIALLAESDHPFKPAVLPNKGRYQGTFLCPNGITATPVIDRNRSMLYVLSADGALFGLDLASGKVRYGSVQFVAAYARALSLNLVDGVVYTTLAQGCGNALSGVYGVDVRDPLAETGAKLAP